jgi:hypothetical protein
MAHVKSEGTADRQTAEADGVGIDIEGVRLKGERRVTKHVWRIIPGDQSQDSGHIELPRHEGVLIPDLPSDRAGHEGLDGVVTTLAQQDAAEPDRGASLDTGELVGTIGRLAMQASALTDQLSAMTAQLIEAERGQAKAERAGIMALAKFKAAEARLAEQEQKHQSELEMLRQQCRAEIVDAEAAGEHYLAQLQAVRDRALAEIAGLKRQRDQASAALTAFRALPWWRRAFAPGARQRKAA